MGSDLDLIAVVDAAADPFECRGLQWDLNIFPVPAEILVYTLTECYGMQKSNDKFIRTLNSEVVWT